MSRFEKIGWQALLMMSFVALVLDVHACILTGWFGGSFSNIREAMVIITIIIVSIMVASIIKVKEMFRR